MQRRSFLAGLAGIFAAAQAPAIVREVMPLRSWSWEKDEASGLLVKRQPSFTEAMESWQKDIAGALGLPMVVLFGVDGMVLAEVPMEVAPAQGGAIHLTNPDISIANCSGTVINAMLRVPGVCEVPVDLAGGIKSVCTGQSLDVSVSVGHAELPGGKISYSETMRQAMLEQLARGMRK